MENIKEYISNLLEGFLTQNGFTLYEVKWTKQYGNKVLQVLVDKKGGIEVSDLTLVNEYLSEKLDENDIFEDEYMLEVSSPGAEKALRNLDELKEAIDEYIHIKTVDGEYDGYLLEVNEEILKLKINVKGRIKELTVKKEDLKKARLAVKF